MIVAIIVEDECNDNYGLGRMYSALKLKYPNEKFPANAMFIV